MSDMSINNFKNIIRCCMIICNVYLEEIANNKTLKIVEPGTGTGTEKNRFRNRNLIETQI